MSNQPDDKRIKEIIADLRKATDDDIMESFDIDEDFLQPIVEAMGDDQQKVQEYITNMSDEDKELINGVNDILYGKFMNEEMWNFLDIFKPFIN